MLKYAHFCVIFIAHRLHQQFFAGLADAFQSHINILLARQTVYTSVQWVRHCFRYLTLKYMTKQSVKSRKATHVRNFMSKLTCASLCCSSASPGATSACLASEINLADPSITSRAESSMATAPAGSDVVAATPLAACAKVLRAWAVSLAATPVHKRFVQVSVYRVCMSICVCETVRYLCNAHSPVQHRWAAGPWRNRQPLMYHPGPECTYPTKTWNHRWVADTINVTNRKNYYKRNLWKSLLTDSPGKGFSCLSEAAILASWSSFLRVCTAMRAESISIGPHASWA